MRFLKILLLARAFQWKKPFWGFWQLLLAAFQIPAPYSIVHCQLSSQTWPPGLTSLPLTWRVSICTGPLSSERRVSVDGSPVMGIWSAGLCRRVRMDGSLAGYLPVQLQCPWPRYGHGLAPLILCIKGKLFIFRYINRFKFIFKKIMY